MYVEAAACQISVMFWNCNARAFRYNFFINVGHCTQIRGDSFTVLQFYSILFTSVKKLTNLLILKNKLFYTISHVYSSRLQQRLLPGRPMFRLSF